MLWNGYSFSLCGERNVTVTHLGTLLTKLGTLVTDHAGHCLTDHTSAAVRTSLTQAEARGVRLILLLERPVDNPGFRGRPTPCPGCAECDWPGPELPVHTRHPCTQSCSSSTG
jgi:hypothetical protein